MKVLKKEDISNWKYLHTCSKCNSELQVEAQDLIRYEDRLADYFNATCPVCHNSFNVPTEKIPKLLQIQAKSGGCSGGGSYFDR